MNWGLEGGTNSEMSACCSFSSSLVNIMIVITQAISIRLNSPIGQSVRRCNPPRSPPKIFYSKIFRLEKYFKSILDCVALVNKLMRLEAVSPQINPEKPVSQLEFINTRKGLVIYFRKIGEKWCDITGNIWQSKKNICWLEFASSNLRYYNVYLTEDV